MLPEQVVFQCLNAVLGTVGTLCATRHSNPGSGVTLCPLYKIPYIIPQLRSLDYGRYGICKLVPSQPRPDKTLESSKQHQPPKTGRLQGHGLQGDQRISSADLWGHHVCIGSTGGSRGVITRDFVGIFR